MGWCPAGAASADDVLLGQNITLERARLARIAARVRDRADLSALDRAGQLAAPGAHVPVRYENGHKQSRNRNKE